MVRPPNVNTLAGGGGCQADISAAFPKGAASCVSTGRVYGWRAKHAGSLGHGINLRLAWARAGAEVHASPRLAFTLYVIMAKSITVKRKKAGRPATGTEPLYGLRISDELMGQIQKWGRENSATRSEAIRRLVELGLKAKK